MPVYICLLRGVNVGGANVLRMELLRQVCARLGFLHSRTLLQSGNVVFATQTRKTSAAISQLLKTTLLAEAGINTDVIVRTPAELESVLAFHPMKGRADFNPSHFLVMFLKSDPGEPIRQAVRGIPVAPEELWFHGREIYVHYPAGIGRSKFPANKLSRALGNTPATARNWATVEKLLTVAEQIREELT